MSKQEEITGAMKLMRMTIEGMNAKYSTQAPTGYDVLELMRIALWQLDDEANKELNDVFNSEVKNQNEDTISGGH